jgi:dephospho-CoA kinase
MSVVMRLGLTGGIGSGKSTVAQMMLALGAHLVDTDAISRQLTAPGGAALPAVRAAFGQAVFDPHGSLNRAALREQVFGDDAQRRRLEALLHPLIGQQAQAEAQAGIDAGAMAVVFDVPLLAESSHWRQRVDRVLVVDCCEATQIQRVATRVGWSEDAARRVMATQAPRAARRAIADAVLFNDGLSIDALRLQVCALWAVWSGPQRGVKQ